MTQTDNLTWLLDGGDMGERIHRHDWDATTIGAATSWPASLRIALGILLGLPQPALLLWGEQLLQFYNDPCRALLGERFPDMLGRPFSSDWPFAWPLAAPLHDTLLGRTHSATFHQQPLTVFPSGAAEQRLYTVTCSPVRGDDGAAGGMLLMLQDTGMQAQSVPMPDEVFFPSCRYVAEAGGIPLTEQRLRRCDVAEVQVQVSAGSIAEQQRILDALRISNEQLKLAIEGSGEGIWDWDIGRDLYSFSDKLKRMLAWSPDNDSADAVKEALRKRIHPDDLPRIWMALRAYIEGRESAYACEFRVQRGDGSWLWMLSRGIIVARDDDGKPLLMTGTMSDISTRKEADEKIWQHANFDALTGLPNRRLFRDRLDQEVLKAARSGLQVALLFIDLDHFKQVNDLLGHDAGDLLLAQCANRIKGCVRDSDTVARLGGDEFTVILTALESPAQVEQVCQKILQTLESPFPINKEVAYMSGSIGVTLYPNDATTSEELIRKADQAMYAAKNAGKNQFSYFTYAMDEAAHLRLRLAAELRGALPGGQLEVYYQPVLDLSSGRLAKAEALLRWHHPRLGLVEPTSFIALAEETGLINQIGNWVFKQAASRSRQWSALPGGSFQISVNKSPIQFLSHNDDADWLKHLERLDLPGSAIAVEITESMLLHASSSVTSKLLEYRDAGIQVAIDDFGTGYSSMAHLKKFDIDYLKIDQSFVSEIAIDDGSRIIAESIIVMAHKLGMKVIAEGIETEAQLNLLIEAGCDYGQGFLFSAALSAAAFEQLLLASREGRSPWQGLF